jgi:glycerol-3-phosphate dehydrogenase (NAD(P)+)
MPSDSTSKAGNRVAVIGAGSWGTALAIVAVRAGHEVRLWTRDESVARSITQHRKNPYYLARFELPETVSATTSLEAALLGAAIAVVVVPSHAMRETLSVMTPFLNPNTVLVTATKGVENGTLMRMSQVIIDVVGPRKRLVVLSGPSFAQEVAKGDPTAIVAASDEPEWCEFVQKEFSSSSFRVYTNDDVVGVELGGAVKNVVAIGAGVVTGLGLGNNSVAAVITRGLAEISRFAIAQGARSDTLAGLAGLGDLVLTCTGDLSRNRRVGLELGHGRKLDEILADSREVAEGVKTTKAIYDLSRRLGVEMPITTSIYSLLYGGKTAIEAANELMGRPLKRE